MKPQTINCRDRTSQLAHATSQLGINIAKVVNYQAMKYHSIEQSGEHYLYGYMLLIKKV